MSDDNTIVNMETQTISFLAPTPLRFEKIDLREAKNQNYAEVYSAYNLLLILFVMIAIMLLSYGVITLDS